MGLESKPVINMPHRPILLLLCLGFYAASVAGDTQVDALAAGDRQSGFIEIGFCGNGGP